MLFKDIIGQAEIKKRLIQSANSGRIAHAQLFYGPQGSGVLPLALAYAQYLFCSNKQDNDACGQCPSCSKIEKYVHPDLHFSFPIILSKTSRTSSDNMPEWRGALVKNPYIAINQWQQLLDAENKQAIINVEESADILKKLSLTAYEGGYKMLLMWMPERMNTQAANKLLKVIEEPPDKTIFILVTENEDQLLRTIVSRTQLIKVNRLTDEDIKAALINNKGLPENDAEHIAFLADGDYSEALSLAQLEGEDKFNYTHFTNWMRMCYEGSKGVVGAVRWCEIMAQAGREKQKSFLTYGINIVRESLMHSYTGGSLNRIGGDELTFVKRFSPFINGANCEEIIEELNKAMYHIERNANAKILFTDLSFKMMTLLKQKAEIKV